MIVITQNSNVTLFHCEKRGMFKETDLFDQITFESISVC